MSIPDLTDDGRLPPGLHPATPDEIVHRFCTSSERRRALEAPFRVLVDIARESAAKALYINGSFVTDKVSPRDFDAVIVLPNHFDVTGSHADKLRSLYKLHGIDIERVPEHDTETLTYLLTDFYGTDRNGIARGLLEVIL